MGLNHQRIALSWLVVHGLVQPASPLPPFLVLPFVYAGLPEFDILELRIGVPEHSRCPFVCSNKPRRLVQPLPHGNFETSGPSFRLTFDPSCDLPDAIIRTPVLRSFNGVVLVVVIAHHDVLLISVDKTNVLDPVIALLDTGFSPAFEHLHTRARVG